MKIPNYQQDPTGHTWLLQMGLIQAGFDVKADNWRGPKTEKALRIFSQSLESLSEGDWNKVKASSFADQKDITAFYKCKSQGKTDSFCFSKGDNGKGYWGHSTGGDAPMVALPREIWLNAGKKGGDNVEVRYKDKIVAGVLGDTMPSLANIKNEAGIDLNPGFQKAFDLKPPFLIADFEWRWA